MIVPRNTLVLVELFEKKEEQVGGILIPGNAELYCEGIVRAVGPGNINAAGARPETHDLEVGDRVLVKFKEIRPMGNSLAKSESGIRFTHKGKQHMLFEQTSIVALIVPDPPAFVN